MKVGVHELLLILAFVCFVLHAIKWPDLVHPNLQSTGLALWVLAILIG